jgi:hypothetical protein
MCLVLQESDQVVVFPQSVVHVVSLKDSSDAGDFEMAGPLRHIVVKLRAPANNPRIFVGE